MIAKRYDIVVIGGGVIGLATARELAGAGLRLAVFDNAVAQPPATRAAAGMLAPSFEDGLHAGPLYHLSLQSRRLWASFAPALEKETSHFIDYRANGILGVAFSEQEADDLRRQAEALSSAGDNEVLVIDGDQARALEPSLSDAIVSALFAVDDGQVDGAQLSTALRISLERRGAEYHLKPIIDATRETSGWRLGLADGEMFADRVVFATGAAPAWPSADVPAPPLFPVKGEACSLIDREPPVLSRVIRARGAYVCPKADQRIVIGASETPHRDDLSVSDVVIDRLKAGAQEVAPATATLAECDRWSGLRPGTPDGAPILGQDKRGAEGAFLALGHYRNGILLAPASAAVLAEQILNGKGDDDGLDAFRPERFG